MNWNKEMEELLWQHYPNGDRDELAKLLGVTRSALKSRADKLGIKREADARWKTRTETPEQCKSRIEKAQATRRELRRRDELRQRWGLETLGEVKRKWGVEI